MNIISLYYFSELAKDLHMTRTASRLYISQQNLSSHIQRLEEYYGTPLLNRKPGLSLTCAGEFVLEFAQTVNRENTNLKDILSDINHQERGVLRFGASLPRASISLPAILPLFFAKYPNVEIRFTDDISAKLEPMIFNGELDFAVILTEEPDIKLVKHHLMQDQVFLCVSEKLLNKHYGDEAEPLKKKAIHGAHVEDFIRIPFSLLSNRLGKKIRACFEDAKCSPEVIFASTYSQLIAPLCSQGLSACFISQMTLVDMRDQIAGDVNIFPLYFRDEPMTQNLSLIYHSERYLPRYAKYFLDTLLQFFADIEQTRVSRII